MFDCKKIGAALLMSYYRAVQIAGTINSTIIRQTMKTMDRIETFACPIEYQNNGTNIHAQLYLMQNLVCLLLLFVFLLIFFNLFFSILIINIERNWSSSNRRCISSSILSICRK